MSTTFHCEFAVRDRVTIDGDPSLVATVIGILWRETGLQAELSWVHAGSVQSAWIDVTRLRPAEVT